MAVGVGAAAAYYVWGRDACFTFESVSIADDSTPQDKTLAESIKNELTTKVFCGAALILPFVVLLLGIGIAWVRRGFASKT